MESKILIVDDDAHLRETLRDLLEMEGYVVFEAASGAEAMKRVVSDFYHVILMDFNLTDKTGIEVIKDIRKLNTDSQILMMTAHASLDTAVKAIQESVYEFHRLFKPSTQLARPHAMIGVNIVAADTDEQARHLFTTQQQHFTRMRRNTRGQLPPPIDNMDTFWSLQEKAAVTDQLSCSVVGSPETLERGLRQLIEKTGASEFMMTGQIFEHQARLHSFEIAAQVMKTLQATPTTLST